ncbi:hypothetical protein BHE74_00052643, partial [Ensete ventricosum]
MPEGRNSIRWERLRVITVEVRLKDVGSSLPRCLRRLILLPLEVATIQKVESRRRVLGIKVSSGGGDVATLGVEKTVESTNWSAKGRGHRWGQPGGEGGSRKQCPFTSLISSTADARSHGDGDGKERLETEGANGYRFSNDLGEELSSRSLVRNHQGRIAREGITLVSTRDRWVVSPDVSAKASPLHCEPP